MWDPYAEFQSAMLPNGLIVHATHWPERPWEVIGFLIHSGAEHDPIGLEGLSHFVEHMVSKNTNIPRKGIDAFFEDCGGSISLGATGSSDTCYQFFVPANKEILTKAFSIFGHMLFSAKIEKFVEHERKVIINEFCRYHSVKHKFNLDMRRHKMLYAGYWLERFVDSLGNPESIKQIKQSDLQSHYDMHYTPANMSIVGVGGIHLKKLVEILSESPFAANKKGARTPLPTPTTDVAPPLETRHVFEVSKSVAGSTDIGGYQSFAKFPSNINECIIHIIEIMLDKILDEEVRQRRAWTYNIDASYCNFRHFYEFSIKCNTLTLDALDDIEEVIENCIVSIANRKDLLEQTKHYILAESLMTDLTGRSVCDGAINDLSKYQRIISLKEMDNTFERVTMSHIQNALQWLQPDRRWTLIICP